MTPLQLAMAQMRMEEVVIDTNVFVAAGFNARSASERILAAIRARRFNWSGTNPRGVRPS